MAENDCDELIMPLAPSTVFPLLARPTATITSDPDGRWTLDWPDGQRSVEISRELMEEIVNDHNERVTQ